MRLPALCPPLRCVTGVFFTFIRKIRGLVKKKGPIRRPIPNFRWIMIKRISPFLFNRWTRNVLFWLLIAFLHYYPRTDLSGYLTLFAIVLVVYGTPVYINNLWLIPRFL